MLAHWKKSYDQPRQHIKKQKHYFADKCLYSQRYGFSSSHVWMWDLDHKESWALKNWSFGTVLLEKTLESPLDCKEIKPVNPKGNQPWIFIGRTDDKAEAPILWLTDVKNQLIRKDPDSGKDWMASPTQWTWAWASSRRWWRTGKPGVLQSMGSQRVRHNWAIEQKQQILNISINVLNKLFKSSHILKIAAFISTRKKKIPLATLTQIIW